MLTPVNTSCHNKDNNVYMDFAIMPQKPCLETAMSKIAFYLKRTTCYKGRMSKFDRKRYQRLAKIVGVGNARQDVHTEIEETKVLLERAIARLDWIDQKHVRVPF